jgi:hypothetical protein
MPISISAVVSRRDEVYCRYLSYFRIVTDQRLIDDLDSPLASNALFLGLFSVRKKHRTSRDRIIYLSNAISHKREKRTKQSAVDDVVKVNELGKERNQW